MSRLAWRVLPACVLASAAPLVASPAFAQTVPKTALGRALAALMQPTSAFEWGGVYAGAEIGYALGKDEWTLGPIVETFAPRGAVGGLHAGYNWRKTNIVLGVEADAGFAAQRAEVRYRSVGIAGTAEAALRSEPGWRGALRFRAGYVRGASLAYVTGGVAAVRARRWGDLNVSLGRYDFTFEAEHAPVQLGWTLGAGLEYALAPNWTARAEYRYSDFGVAPWRAIDPDARHRLVDHALRIGASYHFRDARQAH